MEKEYKEYLSMITLEYNAMRDEIRTSHSQCFLTVQITLAACIALIGYVISNIDKIDAFNASLILAFIIPVISFSALMFILSETVRMKRAGDYICILESKAKIIFDKQTIIFENDLLQERIKNDLKITKTKLDLGSPLSFESWIRELSNEKDGHGRAFFMLQFRYLLFFLIPVLTFISALILQFSYFDKYILIKQNYYIYFIYATICVIWGIYLLRYSFNFVQQSKQKAIRNMYYRKVDTTDKIITEEPRHQHTKKF